VRHTARLCRLCRRRRLPGWRERSGELPAGSASTLFLTWLLLLLNLRLRLLDRRRLLLRCGSLRRALLLSLLLLRVFLLPALFRLLQQNHILLTLKLLLLLLLLQLLLLRRLLLLNLACLFDAQLVLLIFLQPLLFHAPHGIPVQLLLLFLMLQHQILGWRLRAGPPGREHRQYQNNRNRQAGNSKHKFSAI
jgi:hypothetical protein